MRSLQWDWRLLTLFLLVVTANIYVGFSAALHSEYPSAEAVFGGFMNGPVRLLFPVIVGVLGAAYTAAEVSHRHIASTRTRTGIRRHLASRFAHVAVVIFVLLFAVGMLTWICAFIIIPTINPTAINPGGYGLDTTASIFAHSAAGAPLAGLLQQGPFVFALTASAWLGLNGALFALVAVLAVYVFPRPFMAFLAPFAVYLVQSVVLQVAGLPGASFLISAVYPSGLQSYPLEQALIPTVCLAGGVLLGIVALLVTANRNPQFS